ncbi:MAG TPA: hypothetical protein VFT09_01915, partial [Ilumatobacteraceae bacterium]|nr:hypothetical protein [Ilumatobacteraceae bacterium]
TGSDFADGGGYLADESAAIAVLPDADGEAFGRGRRLRVTGEIDDRFGQRTLRVAAGGIVDLGPATEPSVVAASTGTIGEAIEGRLVRIVAAIVGPASTLTTGVAFDVDDGSGPTRLIVATATSIEVSDWDSGTVLDVIGVVGQRDSSGTGSAGYRVQPRDADDLLSATPPAVPTATPTPTSDPSTSAGPSASASPEPGVMTIAQARAAPRNARVRVQGTVTLPTGVVDAQTAAIQDATGAIVLRLSDEAGSLRLGQRIDVGGARSTKGGMETIRVTTAPRPLGAGAEPAPRTRTTGAAAEAHEAQLIVVRGGLVASARRASSGTVSMEIDDGSGPLRIVAGSSLAVDRTALVEGAWIEVRGVLGQETTGAQPLRGYRVWPRAAGDVRITAAATDAGGDGTGGSGDADGAGTSSGSGAPAGDLGDLGDLGGSSPAGAVGATLVVGRWPELGLGGLLWDGERLVGLAAADAVRTAVALAGRRPPVALELNGLRPVAAGRLPAIPMVAIGRQAGAIRMGDGHPTAPSTARPQSGESARWYAVVGRLEGGPGSLRVRTATSLVPLDRRCGDDASLPRGFVTVAGIALPGREALIVACGGILAASTLERAVAVAGRIPASTDAGSSARHVDATSAPAAHGVVAAALLGAAAFVLAGGAAWVRWHPGHPSPDEAGASGDPGEEAPDGGTSATSLAAPVLTLVTLPHERSP